MKIICNTASLTQACLNIQRCVPTRAILPMLDGILMRTLDNGTVELCGYDLELGSTTTVEARIEEHGATVINAKTMCDILRHLPGDRVELSCNAKNICTVTCGNVEYTIVALRADEYPDLPSLPDTEPIQISAKLLRSMVMQTIFAASTEEAKAVHRGVKFEIREGELKCIAIDGYRLAIRTEFIAYNGAPHTFIVPSKTLYELVKLLPEEDEFVKIRLSRRHIIFETNNYNIVSRLLEGDFLDYRTALPKGTTATVRVNTKKLLECIERTSIIVTEKMRSPLRFLFDGDMIRLSVATAVGSASDFMDCSLDGKRTEIGFNARYVSEALRACESDEVLIRLNGSIAPALIVPTEGEHFLYLILPVRIADVNG